MKLKKCFVVCWYGEWPIYFQSYLNSCKYNSDWNWIFFSDSCIEKYKIPPNIDFLNSSLEELRKLFASKLNIKIDNLTPYKLCDFRPAYGLIFEEYLKQYDYWGFCDIDLIWGNLSYFFPDEMIGKYDKVLTHGHMTLFKNSEENRDMFKSKISKYVDYKIVFRSKYNWGFDEVGRYSIDKIIKQRCNYKCYRNNMNIADIYPYKSMCTQDMDGIREIECVVVNDGVYVKYKNRNDMSEKAYIHLQKRKICNYDVIDESKFYIFNNEIVDDISKKKDIVEILSPPNKIHFRVIQLYRLFDIVKYIILGGGGQYKVKICLKKQYISCSLVYVS